MAIDWGTQYAQSGIFYPKESLNCKTGWVLHTTVTANTAHRNNLNKTQ